MEDELNANRGSQGLDLPETITDISRVTALTIKTEKRAESGHRVANKEVTKDTADPEDDDDNDDDSEDNQDKDTAGLLK